MLDQNATRLKEKADLNPYVSGLAARLVQRATASRMKVDSQGWQLIAEVMSYAATAEQRMVELQERISHLEELSQTDDLTGIPNRRGLRKMLGQTLASAARHGDSGVLGFIDLDGFKDINDRHGHAAGDAVLRHVAALLKKRIRPTDIVARIAGDEFAIILTRCTAEHGMKRLQTLKQIIAGSTIEWHGLPIPISCSIGGEAFSGTADPAQLIARADKAMYADKAAGKNAGKACHGHMAATGR
ncbi:GGDEF domain-containing protein [Eilatimonas milleporae]|uniref:diguanylate cyclase n=1 Tax=Eilatimonas milleporae TaxID=911205 RepID=A0A3M0CBT5_9PROT|nr:GGDEF domain-containing protein [Eilatimonas milleporae]RMB04479.1 diguanylate cyclase (GGDEF)-like protein [Eilatimonas milleporae]